MRRGLLLILSSPSGAGKSTLARRLMAWDRTIRFSVSATTRQPRPGEEDGREYYFRSREVFETMVKTGEMLEHAEVFGNFYGSPKGPVEAAMKEGRDTLFDIDWQAEYDYVIVNRDIDTAFNELTTILQAERLKRDRQPDLSEFVRTLNAEFASR
jgi:guanylate kinase